MAASFNIHLPNQNGVDSSMMIWVEQSRRSINHADMISFPFLCGMAWHDKFKSCGSANFLFHFSLTRYRNWILFTLLRQLDGLRQSSSWHFIIFHPTTKIERSKGCAAWKSNRANGLFISFGHKTIYMIDDNIFLLNCEVQKMKRFVNQQGEWIQNLHIHSDINSIRRKRRNGEDWERKVDLFGCTCPYFYDAIINTSQHPAS